MKKLIAMLGSFAIAISAIAAHARAIEVIPGNTDGGGSGDNAFFFSLFGW